MRLLSSRKIPKRSALRLGFGILLALLLLSAMQAFRIQRGLTLTTEEIYHRHLKQDELTFELRRTLWFGANYSRDFLINPNPDRLETFQKQLAAVKVRASKMTADLTLISEPSPLLETLKGKISEYWRVLDGVPILTQSMSAEQRYEFVQREVAVRRNNVGEMVRQFEALNREALQASDSQMSASHDSAAKRLIATLGLSLILGLVVSALAISHSDRLELETAVHYAEVTRTKDELARLSARLMDVQEEERAQLSRELHDEIGQALATARLEIVRAETLPEKRAGELRERLSRARAVTEQSIKLVKHICLLLRPSLLDDLGLAAAIQWQLDEFTRRSGVTHEFSGADSEDTLPEHARTCAYRILQESLHNCEKHARATRVRVEIRQDPEGMLLSVRDNGKGFDPGAVETSGKACLGLLGMRERAVAAGGALTVDSKPGQGTTVSLRLPHLAPGSLPAGDAESAVAV